MRILLLLCCFHSSIILWSQESNENYLPYKGGPAQFEADIRSSLLVASEDSGRVFFAELTYSRNKKEVECKIHGALERNKMLQMVEQFFAAAKEKWNKRFLKKSSVIIPLIIIPNNDNSNASGSFIFMNRATMHDAFSNSFKAGKYFLYKPIFFFRNVMEVDMD